jgi:hypothetical protein
MVSDVVQPEWDIEIWEVREASGLEARDRVD